MAYDSTTANPVNPQGTAGGGNAFNIASLFGEGSFFFGGSTKGSGAASTAATDTAAATGGTATPTLGAVTTGAPLASHLALWVGLSIAAIAAGVWWLFRRQKKS